jgi:hypothetical protein
MPFEMRPHFRRLGMTASRFADALVSRIKARSIPVQLIIAGAAVLTCCSNVSAKEVSPSGSGNSLLSRITVEIPLLTRHIPANAGFNDHNWGVLVDVELSPDWSLALGSFTNSYYRNTVVAGARYSFFSWDLSSIKIDTGMMLGLDLNGGYEHRSSVDPLVGALSLKITGNNFSEYEMLNRTGVAFTVIPGDTFAINVALAFGL